MIHRLKPNESVSINGSTVNVAIDEGYVVLDVQIHDRDLTLLQEFVEFHLAYPAVYQQFLDECRRRVANDQPARARSVLTHVRLRASQEVRTWRAAAQGRLLIVLRQLSIRGRLAGPVRHKRGRRAGHHQSARRKHSRQNKIGQMTTTQQTSEQRQHADDVPSRKRRRRTREQQRRERRADKVRSHEDFQTTIACPAWLVTAARGGLAALLACQLRFWFLRSTKHRPEDWPECWFGSWADLAEQLHIPAGRAGRKRLRCARDRLVTRHLVEVRQCPGPAELTPIEFTYPPPVIQRLSRIPRNRRLAIVPGDAMVRPETARRNTNAVYPAAAARFGENEAIVLAWLIWITSKRKEPPPQSRGSISRMTGLTARQAEYATRSLRRQRVMRRTWHSEGIVATSVYQINPDVLGEFSPPQPRRRA